MMVGCIGCRREGIRVYDVPKEKHTQTPAVLPRVELPEGWEQKPPTQMAFANFVVHGNNGTHATVTFSSLPVSDELANVNRWRRQVNLQPATAEELDKLREKVQVADQPAALYDVAGDSTETGKKTRILAIMQRRGDSFFFFKMMGDDELVAAQKSAFTKFVANYPPADAESSSSSLSASADPHAGVAGAPPLGATATPEVKASGNWKAPAGWIEQQPGAMQDAKFSVAGGKATVVLSIFQNSGGALDANINRWRGQIGLEPASDADLARLTTSLDLGDAKATIIDMTGPKQRLVAIVVTRGERNFYFKLLGEPDAVASEKNAFIEFAKTTK